MANIIKTMEKELQNGRNFITPKGDTVSLDTVTKLAERAYIKALNKKEIPVQKTFEDFMVDFLEGYSSLSAMLGIMKATIKYEEPAPLPEPAEPENVAI